MKGVIVQVGEPKSIVLFNNGRIRAIPTPADCHVGMVVTVKLNSTLKIMAIILAAVLLLAAGVFIGATLINNKGKPVLPPQTWERGSEQNRVTEHGKQIQTVTVAQAKNLSDDSSVLLTGNITQSLGDEKYTFRDPTGDITVEIDRKIFRAASVDVSDTVEISGEVDIERKQVIIDVKNIRKLQN